MKRCRRCSEEKHPMDFYRNSTRKDGLQSDCKACQTEIRLAWTDEQKEAHLQRGYAWRRKNPKKARENHRRNRLKALYGITADEYQLRLNSQAGGCAICGDAGAEDSSFPLEVDHDHETGRVRGLLCGRCNRALGLLDDSPFRLGCASTYLVGARAA